MSPAETAFVLEALRSARTELRALIEDDIHVPSGELMEQLDEAITIMEAHHNASI